MTDKSLILHFTLSQLYEVKHFEFAWLVWNTERDVKENGKKNKMCISDIGLKLEGRLNTEYKLGIKIGHKELSEICKRLCHYGFLSISKGPGNRKVLSVTPECRQILESLKSIKEAEDERTENKTLS